MKERGRSCQAEDHLQYRHFVYSHTETQEYKTSRRNFVAGPRPYVRIRISSVNTGQVIPPDWDVDPDHDG